MPNQQYHNSESMAVRFRTASPSSADSERMTGNDCVRCCSEFLVVPTLVSTGRWRRAASDPAYPESFTDSSPAEKRSYDPSMLEASPRSRYHSFRSHLCHGGLS